MDKQSRLSLITVLYAEFIDYAGIAIVYPLFAFMLFDPSFHFLPTETSASTRGAWLGFLIALHPLLQFFCAPIFGSLSDLKGRKSILKITMGLSLVGYAIACIACFKESLLLLATYRICVGIAAGNCSVISAIVADLSTLENKVQHYGLLNMAFGAGFTLGPFLGGILAHRFHIATTFFTAFCFVGMNWLLVTWKLQETLKSPLQQPCFFRDELGKLSAHCSTYRAHISNGKFTRDLTRKTSCQPKSNLSCWLGIIQIKQAALMPELRFLFLGLLIFSFGWSFFTEFASLFLIDRFQFTPKGIGFYYAFTGFVYAFSAGFFIHFFMRRLKKEKILFFSMLLSGIYLWLFAFIHNEEFMWFYLPLLQFFLSFVYPLICAEISNRVSEKRQGEVMGIYQGVIALALALTPLCSGFFVGLYPILVIVVSGFLMVMAAFIYLLLKDKVAPLNID